MKSITKSRVEYTVNIENKKHIEIRIAKFQDKINIKDDTKKKPWFFDKIVNGKWYHTEARYVRCLKEEAYAKIDKKKQEKFKELTVYFE